MSSDIPPSFGLADASSELAPKRVWGVLALISLSIVVVIALHFLTSTRVGNEGGGKERVGVGELAPTIELVRLSQDGTLQFHTQLDPSCVCVLHLWGTWCGPCREEYPHLDAMIRELRQEGSLDFLSVSCESGNETVLGLTMKTHDYLRSIDAVAVVYADPNGTTRRSLVQRLRQEDLFYPTTVVIDRRGVMRGVWQGYDPSGVDQMRATIKDLWAAQ